MQKITYLKALLLAVVMACGSLAARAQSFNWVNGILGDKHNSANATAVDVAGNVYVGGIFYGTADFDPGPGEANLTVAESWFTYQYSDAYLAKYDAAGNYIRAISIKGNAQESINGIATDAAGNVYVVGVMGSDTTDFGPGVGNVLKAHQAMGNVGIFIAKYDSSGYCLWAKSIGGGGYDVGAAIVLDEQDNIYITGRFLSDVGLDFDPGPGETLLYANPWMPYFASYDKDGNFRWAHAVEGGGIGNSLAYDGEGGVYFVGYVYYPSDFDPGPAEDIQGGATAWSSYITRYDTAGNYQWAKTVSSTGSINNFAPSGNDYALVEFLDVALDDAKSIYVTGVMRGSIDMDPGPGVDSLYTTTPPDHDILFAKYDSTGNYVWGYNIGNPSPTMGDHGGAINVQGGAVYLTGYFNNTTDFDPGPGEANLVSNGMGLNGIGDIFIAKYDTTGIYKCAQSVGGSRQDEGVSIALSTSGELYVAGSFQDTVDFDPGTGTAELSNPLLITDNPFDLSGSSFLLKLGCQEAYAALSDTICAGGGYTLGDSIFTTPGIHAYVMPDASSICGCDSVITLNLALAQVSEPVITVNEFVLGLTNTYSTYQWIENGTVIAGATNATLTVTENGDYQVAVTTEEGCADTSAIYEVTNATGIRSVHPLVDKVWAYPNPADNMLYIHAPASVRVDAVLTGIDGRAYLALDNVRQLSLSGLAQGVYILQLSDKDGLVIRREKIVKQ